jgi:hypothetical protein
VVKRLISAFPAYLIVATRTMAKSVVTYLMILVAKKNANSSPERLPLPIRLIFGAAASSCPTFQSGASICQVSVSQSD